MTSTIGKGFNMGILSLTWLLAAPTAWASSSASGEEWLSITDAVEPNILFVVDLSSHMSEPCAYGGDGEVDEGFTLGTSCQRGLGGCAREGVTVCARDGDGTRCDAEEGTPEEERCDELDNDCDGDAQEGFDANMCQ